MTRLVLPVIAGALALSAGASAAQHEEHARPAATGIRNARNQVVGEAAAIPERGLVRVRVTVRGFAPGTYGVHLHQVGRCEGPAFESAGPHFNPAGRHHGRLNPQGPHLGDLPNLVVSANGAGRIDFELQVPAATETGANPLLDADGTAVVIHATADDERTDPSGNSGARIACGVLAPVR